MPPFRRARDPGRGSFARPREYLGRLILSEGCARHLLARPVEGRAEPVRKSEPRFLCCTVAFPVVNTPIPPSPDAANRTHQGWASSRQERGGIGGAFRVEPYPDLAPCPNGPPSDCRCGDQCDSPTRSRPRFQGCMILRLPSPLPSSCALCALLRSNRSDVACDILSAAEPVVTLRRSGSSIARRCPVDLPPSRRGRACSRGDPRQGAIG